MTTSDRWGGRPNQKFLVLTALFVLALLPRLYSSQTVGTDWFFPGSYTVVNFDEANTCRAYLDSADYSPLVGAQTAFIASLLGDTPPQAARGNYAVAKGYCMGETHMRVARAYSAVLGALTVVVLAAIALFLSPDRPRVAWVAGLLLALSGFHATQSHMATVDVAMTFYLYLFVLSLMYAVARRSMFPLLLSVGLMFPAVFAKRIWPMPIFGYLAFLPEKLWLWIKGEMNSWQVAVVFVAALVMAAFAFNSGFQQSGYFPLLALFYLAVPWKKVNRGMLVLFIALPVVTYLLSISEWKYVYFFTSGRLEGRWGTSFGAIGWNKMPRNLVNFPLLPVMGLGILASLMIPAGLRHAFRDKGNVRLWLCFMPIIVLAAYMLLVAPRTTWRHYLPLLPAMALLASYGFWSLRASSNKLALAIFLAWPALLLVDFQMDFHQDPRRQIVSWYEQHPNSRAFITFYAVPPSGTAGRTMLFQPEYAMGAAEILKSGDYLVLSENWYDTAFANELNGPITSHLDRLVKTKPEYAMLYRRILEGQHRNLVLEAEYNVSNFMPELILHKKYYGTFQKFVGDLKVFRIVK